MIVLDTHALVWSAGEVGKLGRKVRGLIDQHWAQGQVAVSAISFWEIGMLQTRGRLRLPAPARAWRESIIVAGVVELAVDGEVALRSIELDLLPEDPADRFIVATALVHGATLVTADERLLDWKHDLKRIDARK